MQSSMKELVFFSNPTVIWQSSISSYIPKLTSTRATYHRIIGQSIIGGDCTVQRWTVVLMWCLCLFQTPLPTRTRFEKFWSPRRLYHGKLVRKHQAILKMTPAVSGPLVNFNKLRMPWNRLLGAESCRCSPSHKAPACGYVATRSSKSVYPTSFGN